MASTGRNQMVAVHNGFRCGLAVAPALIRGAEGDAVRRARVAAFLTSSLTIIESHHHEEEETLYPLLLSKDPGAAAVLEAGVSEHHGMIGRLEAAKAAVAAWSVDEIEGPEVILELVALEGVFTTHLDHEEATIVPLLDEYFDEETWDMLDAHLAERLPEIAGLLLPVAFGLSLLWEAVGEAAIKDVAAAG